MIGIKYRFQELFCLTLVIKLLAFTRSPIYGFSSASFTGVERHWTDAAEKADCRIGLAAAQVGFIESVDAGWFGVARTGGAGVKFPGEFTSLAVSYAGTGGVDAIRPRNSPGISLDHPSLRGQG